MKVVGVVGSPRRQGNTEILTAYALKAIAEEGVETELITLAGKEIKPCDACMLCHEEERCSIDDDLFPIYQKIKEADGIILSSPIYFGSITGLMKCFIERAGFISRRHGEPFHGKVGGPIVVARRAGQLFGVAQLTFWYQIVGAVVAGSTYWNVAFGREKGEVQKDEEGLRTVWNFGKNIAWAVKKLHAEDTVRSKAV